MIRILDKGFNIINAKIPNRHECKYGALPFYITKTFDDLADLFDL